MPSNDRPTVAINARADQEDHRPRLISNQKTSAPNVTAVSPNVVSASSGDELKIWYNLLVKSSLEFPFLACLLVGLLFFFAILLLRQMVRLFRKRKRKLKKKADRLFAKHLLGKHMRKASDTECGPKPESGGPTAIGFVAEPLPAAKSLVCLLEQDDCPPPTEIDLGDGKTAGSVGTPATKVVIKKDSHRKKDGKSRMKPSKTRPDASSVISIRRAKDSAKLFFQEDKRAKFEELMEELIRQEEFDRDGNRKSRPNQSELSLDNNKVKDSLLSPAMKSEPMFMPSLSDVHTESPDSDFESPPSTFISPPTPSSTPATRPPPAPSAPSLPPPPTTNGVKSLTDDFSTDETEQFATMERTSSKSRGQSVESSSSQEEEGGAEETQPIRPLVLPLKMIHPSPIKHHTHAKHTEINTSPYSFPLLKHGAASRKPKSKKKKKFFRGNF